MSIILSIVTVDSRNISTVQKFKSLLKIWAKIQSPYLTTLKTLSQCVMSLTTPSCISIHISYTLNLNQTEFELSFGTLCI